MKLIIKSYKVYVLIFVILFLYILTQHASIHAQIQFDRLDENDGLPNNTIQHIIEDSQGFIWLGTSNGLLRYDGYTFVPFVHDATDGTTLSSNDVKRIWEDSEGFLWIGTSNGLNRFDQRTQIFTRFYHESENPLSLPGNNVYELYEDRHKRVWIGTRKNGLCYFDREHQTFIAYTHQDDDPNSLSDNQIRAILEDRNGNLWIGTKKGGLNRFDPVINGFIHYRHNPDDNSSISSDTVSALVEDHDGMLWVGLKEGGLDRFDPNTGKFFKNYTYDANDPYSLSNMDTTALGLDHSGRLWVGTWAKGLNLYEPNKDRFRRYVHSPNLARTLPDNSILCLYVDRQGMIWIGTYAGGVSRIDPAKQVFINYYHDPNNPNSLSNNQVKAILEQTPDLLWIGTYHGGLNLYNRQTTQFEHFKYVPQTPEERPSAHDTAWALFQDSRGTLWVGTSGGLKRFDAQTEQFTMYQHQPDDANSLSNNNVLVITEDAQGNLWMGTWYGGVNVFNPETETFFHYTHDPENPFSVSDNIIKALLTDSKGNVWVGTSNGLNRFDKERNGFIRYLYSEDDTKVIPNRSINVIHESQNGMIWIGSNEGGLSLFRENTQSFESYTEQDGLISNTIFGIGEDKDGNLWLSTGKGINKFNPVTKESLWFDAHDGLQGNVFNHWSFHTGKSGRIYFGGTNGLTEFYPENVAVNTTPPSVVFTDFLLVNKSVAISETTPLKQAVNLIDRITLEHKDYIFAFEFAALGFRQPHKYHYAYMLEGFDHDFILTDYKNRRVTYTNVPHGAYTLRVKAANDDGIWNQEGASVQITILPSWWQTWWFKNLLVFLIVGSAVSGYSWRVHALEVRSRVLEQQVAERTQALVIAKEEAEVANQAKSTFLANMSHELRTPLNGILGYAQILKRHRDASTSVKAGLNVIHQSGNHLLTLINDILDLSKIEARKMELYPAEIHFLNFLEGIVGIIRMRAQQKDVRCLYDFASDVPSGIEADEKRLRQVLLNLLGNAVKFTEGGGTVTLRVARLTIEKNVPHSYQSTINNQQSTIRFEIEDTGVGMKAEQLVKIFEPFKQVEETARRTEGTGLGLAISRQLVELMGSEIQVRSEFGTGSTFWFEAEFPVLEIVPREIPARQGEIAGYSGKRRTILVVDDKRDNRLVLLNLLEPLGFEITLAEHGQDGLDKARSIHPDLILMDLVMPVMNGFEAVKALRQLPAFNDVPILAVSASTLGMDQAQSQRIGCNGFVAKPVDADQLFALLETHLQLTWTYADRPVEPEAAAAQTISDADLIPPPQEELEALYELALFGDMKLIQERSLYLEALDEQYRSFTNRLRELAHAFEDEKIVAFIEHSMEENV